MVIVFVACLIANMDSCRQYRLTEYEIQTPQQCVIVSQQELAAWQVGHPERKIVRFRCVPPGREEHAI